LGSFLFFASKAQGRQNAFPGNIFIHVDVLTAPFAMQICSELESGNTVMTQSGC